MSQTATIVPFTSDHIDDAARLFAASYSREREHSPLLPPRASAGPAWIRAALAALLPNPGVALLAQGELRGYMVTGARFPWKEQRTALVPEYGHSAAAPSPALYRQMYAALAQLWVDSGHHLHVIGHLAHDADLKETLFQLGFGAILAERLRDLAPLDEPHGIAVRQIADVSALLPLHLEHNRYYPASPIFITKPSDEREALADLQVHAERGDAFLVCYEQDEPCAYFIVGESAADAEGFLLRQTNTAQIKSAYARQASRGRGVGLALLRSAVGWAQARGYERIFVEHETANIQGGVFWGKHFAPYVCFSMRYVDSSVGVAAERA